MGFVEYYGEDGPMSELEYELEMERMREEEKRLDRLRKSEELQEIYFPLFKKCADYFFERLEKSDRIELDKKSNLQG